MPDLWHRRLWNVSTALALREVVEYADACLSKAVTSTQGLKYVVEAAKHQVDRDPGSAHLASEITARLDELSKSSSSKVPISARDELEQLVRRLKVDYLANWCEKAAPLTSVEFTARALASHLLDLGFSPNHLHRWLTNVAPGLADLGQLAQKTKEMVNEMPTRSYLVFVPCAVPHDKSQVTGQVTWLVWSTPRQVKIGSLLRHGALYRFDSRLPHATDDALELASYMESPLAGAAVTGGWSAIEALLIRPGEGSHHLAADRLASLIACSLPRAELTSLAYQHQKNADDALAQALSGTQTNYAKAQQVEDYLKDGNRLNLHEGSDFAAQHRIIEIIRDPKVELGRIRARITESLRRLYNQRNTISHAGSLRSAALSATTRTSLSLVGAGLDRIVHGQLESDSRLEPLSLVARAEVELSLVGSPGGRALCSLLE